jgi:hypothetical protein
MRAASIARARGEDMRAYALLFGTLATIALGYFAQIAVAGSGLTNVRTADPLWYGGMLEPLAIIGDGAGGPAIALVGVPHPSRATACHEPVHKSRRTAATTRRPQLGVEM